MLSRILVRRCYGRRNKQGEFSKETILETLYQGFKVEGKEYVICRIEGILELLNHFLEGMVLDRLKVELQTNPELRTELKRFQELSKKLQLIDTDPWGYFLDKKAIEDRQGFFITQSPTGQSVKVPVELTEDGWKQIHPTHPSKGMISVPEGVYIQAYPEVVVNDIQRKC